MSYLLSPITIGGLKLANRVVLAPLTRARAGLSRVPNELMTTYYAQRASAGLVITEATAISNEAYGWWGAPAIINEAEVEGWSHVTKAVHDKGGVIFMQLWHMGRQSHSSFQVDNALPVAPSAIATAGEKHCADGEKRPYEVPRALTTEEVDALPATYAAAARNALNAGFDGVEVHAANGYLLDTFLQSSTNVREDKYGGSMENRYRVLGDIIEAVKQVCPADRIGVRVSPNGVFGSMGSADNDAMFPYVAERLSEHGLAYLHTMDGLGFGFHGLCKAVSAFDLKVRFRGPIIANVGFTKDTADGAIRSGAVDMVAFGRPYISNPDLVERFTHDWPLNPLTDMSTWYGGGEGGYTDQPSHKESESATA